MTSWRIRMFGSRFVHFIYTWPSKLFRFICWLLWIKSPRGKHSVYRWASGLILLLADLTPWTLIYETLLDVVKRSTRSMNGREMELASSVFGAAISLHLISIDPDSIPVRMKKAAAYVSFHTINFYKGIPDQMLIHELVHIWQYERYGSAYITEAIWAQRWGGGYNYGGLEPLMKYSQRKGITAFNFEQQADIIEDYFLWKNGLPMQWVVNVPGVGKVLEGYAKEVKR